MGKLSDKIRSARRLGKRERTRGKTHKRGRTFGYVGGVVTYQVTAGRKKYGKVSRHVDRLVAAHLGGDPTTMKSAIKIERPLYKIEMRPLRSSNTEVSEPGDRQAGNATGAQSPGSLH